MRRSARILLNTLASYGRLIFSAVAGLVAVPVALHKLGAADYGIFSVVAGSLSFLLFINGALTTGAQRHVAFSLGRDSSAETHRWLSLTIFIHATVGLLTLVIGWLSAPLVLHHLLRIPEARAGAALYIYHWVVVAMFCEIVSTPYHAYLMAHEALTSLAVAGICGSLFLLAGITLLKVLQHNLLQWYATIYVISQLLPLLIPIAFCLYRYPESRRVSHSGVTRQHARELFSFSGWNLLGAVSGPVRLQGPAILLNRFSGPVANTAYGVALQINGFVLSISTGLMRATSPAIVKSEAAGDRQSMFYMASLTNKYAFLILWLALGPVLIDIKLWLGLWLSHVPPGTTLFTVLLLSALLVDQLTVGIIAALQAHGRIALYQSVVSAITCLSIPLGYFFLRAGYVWESPLYAVVAMAVAAGAARLIFARQILQLPITQWLRMAALPSAAMVLGSLAAMLLIVRFVHAPLLKQAALISSNTLISVFVAWRIASRQERERLEGFVKSAVSRGMIPYRRFVAVLSGP